MSFLKPSSPFSDDAIALLPHLFQFTEEHREEGESLQEDLIKFGTELHEAVDEIWKKPDVEGQNGCQEGWAARMQETDKQRQIDPLDKVAKPELPKRDWNPKLSDIGGKLAE